jgi:ketosteroid isomerase-like protein
MGLRDDVYDLLQDVYFNSIARGDIERAVTALHQDVDWSHQRVWQHHEGDVPEEHHSRQAVTELLTSRRGLIAELSYTVTDLALDGNKGGFLGHVAHENSEPANFIGWVEIDEGAIRRYVIRPL